MIKLTKRIFVILNVFVFCVLCGNFAQPEAVFAAEEKAAEAVGAEDSSDIPEDLFQDEEEEDTTSAERVFKSAHEIEESRRPDDADAEGQQDKKKEVATGRVTLDFKNADIRNVLRIISLKSGMNIIAGNEVEGPVTIRLVDVPWEKALEAVLRTYGFAFERDGNIIRVTTVENLKSEELQTEVFPLKYAKAEEIQATLEEMLSERGTIRADSRTNVLIVTDVPTNLYKISQVIDRIDTITPQVLIEAKIIEMSIGDSEKLGIKWNMQMAMSGSSRPTTFPFSARKGVLDGIDRWFPVGTASSTNLTSAESGAALGTSTDSDFPSVVNQLGDALPTFKIPDADAYVFGTLDFSEMSILMQVIQSRSNSKILSEPRITVLNNQEARIMVGEVLAIPSFERNDSTGRMEITGYEEKDLGIKLQVTPQINSEDQIDVTMHPEIATLIGFDQLTSDIVAPRFAVRDAVTKVRVRNGETIVVGGLIKEDVIDSQSKVPFLGDVPLLGKLFTHNERTVTKTDLLFFVTVTIIEEPEVKIEAATRT